jgi:hypothetical protein
MARKRIYYKWEIPTSVVKIVNSICADYERRERLIKSSAITDAVLAKAVELNAIVDKELEHIEPGIRREIIRDISEGRGYYKSGCCVIMDKNAYYRRRRKLVHDIAVTMSLI